MINKEIRMAVRMAADSSSPDSMIIEGKAIAFNERTCLYKDADGIEYYERILPEAVRSADFSDCCLKYNHQESTPILARTRGGSLTVEAREDGVFFRAVLFDTQFSRDCYELVKADALQCSFAFTIAQDGDSYDAKSRTRTVRSIEKIWDLSIVNNPAYADTYVKACRSYYEPRAEERRIEVQGAELRELFAELDITPTPPSEEDRYIKLTPRDRLGLLAWEASTMADPGPLLAKAREYKAEILKAVEARKRAQEAVLRGDCKVIKTFGECNMDTSHTEEKKEIRAFQQFMTMGLANMNAEERAALDTSGAGAVLPVDIFNSVITSEKYSDLLHRATIINDKHAGTVKIPIMAPTAATWKAENASVTPATGAITSLDLTGKELMRAIQYSAAVESMTTEQFADWMADAVSREVIETLESAFILGDGTDSPHKGLEELTITNTVTATSAITAADLAEAISMLPVKYSRNAIILMNANTALNVVGLFKGTSEYAYSLADGASRFMGHEISINEHISDDKIYIVDPRELYVRFAMDPTVDVDKSVGFLAGTVSVRCLTVVDFAWNTGAVAAVVL